MKMNELETATDMMGRCRKLRKELQAVKAYGVNDVRLRVAQWIITDEETCKRVARSLIAYYEAEISEIHLTLEKMGVTR